LVLNNNKFVANYYFNFKKNSKKKDLLFNNEPFKNGEQTEEIKKTFNLTVLGGNFIFKE